MTTKDERRKTEDERRKTDERPRTKDEGMRPSSLVFRQSGSGVVTFAVKVVPRASRNEIVGVEGDALKIRLHAPPVEGQANEALIAFLAETLGVRRAQIEIVTGHLTRRKVVRVHGAAANVSARLEQETSR